MTPDGSVRDREIVNARVIVTCQLAAKFPYSPKQPPIARLKDGTMWDW
jgi:mannonate dehydratase